MQKSVMNIVEKLRKENIQITNEEAEKVETYCYRKMEIARIKDKEEYLPLLFVDEVKNYLIRFAINTVSILERRA